MLASGSMRSLQWQFNSAATVFVPVSTRVQCVCHDPDPLLFQNSTNMFQDGKAQKSHFSPTRNSPRYHICMDTHTHTFCKVYRFCLKVLTHPWQLDTQFQAPFACSCCMLANPYWKSSSGKCDAQWHTVGHRLTIHLMKARARAQLVSLLQASIRMCHSHLIQWCHSDSHVTYQLPNLLPWIISTASKLL